MFKRLRTHLSYANVMATVAVFVALGGTSYAALRLPRNSVGSAQIRTGAVSSSEVRDRSVRLRDISPSARTSLKAQRGPAGPIGPQGLPGAPAMKFFAAVSSGGTLLRGNATSGGRDTNVGTYTVGFAQPVGDCAFAATLGSTDSSTAPPGRITVNQQGGRVGVQTFDASGAPTDLPFHLIVAC